MRKLRKSLLVGASLIALSTGVAAQQSPNVFTETATTPRSGVQCQSVTATINTQNTLTFNVPSGLRLYLTHLYLASAQDATAGAITNLNFTTTNLQSLAWQITQPATANLFTLVASHDNPNGFAVSAVGPLNVTIVSPANQAHAAFPMHACGFFAQ